MKLIVCVYKTYIIQEHNRLFRKPPLPGPPLSLSEYAIIKHVIRSVFKISSLFLRPRLWQFEI